MRAALTLLFGLVVVGPGWEPPAVAQPVHPDVEQIELGLTLRQLGSVGSFMMATAHPDDENNGLLARLARGDGHRTVLATATRGDGGQNELGPELFDALAVLRTEELLAAHRLDGAEQFFTRAVDFGYSFSREETFARWGRDEILGDFVRLIRTVRPDVVTALSPEGEGGGQHHQASAILAHEAYRAAGDPNRFAEQIEDGLRPWQPRKFYYSAGFGVRFGGASPSDDLTTIDLAVYDPLLGRTYAQVGSQARSMHKCQGMSPMISLPGPESAAYRLVASTIPGQLDRDETDLFAGIDTSIAGLARFAGPEGAPELEDALSALGRLVSAAQEAYHRGRSDELRDGMASGVTAVRELRARLPSLGLSDDAQWEIDFRLAAKERQFERAMVLAHGLSQEVLADDGVVTPGQLVRLTAIVANHGAEDLAVLGVQVAGVVDEAGACETRAVAPAGVYRCETDVTIPPDAAFTDIHWTSVPGAARYRFDPAVPFGVPFRPTPYLATVSIEVSGVRLDIERPIRHRYSTDLFTGEKRSTLHVVPRLTVDVSPETTVMPLGSGASRELRVTVTNEGEAATAGVVGLDLPAGWSMEPPTAGVRLSREGEARTLRFMVTPTDVASEQSVTAWVEASGVRYDLGYQAVEYPHIGRRHLLRPAQSTIKVVDVSLPEGLHVGYIEGVGDAVPPAIEQLGASLERLDADDLAWGDLSRFDVIVTGVRAYERRADLRAGNERLLGYVEAGGTLVVQYNRFEFNDAQFGPYPAEVSRDRVTDEQAPIRILAPDHPVFGWPNPIGSAVWENWVQERGLYFLGAKDDAYVDLVELEDTFAWNPGVKRGALVEARHGAGRWLYVGLGLWRQLSAGTTGAYALLANLLSLGLAE